VYQNTSQTRSADSLRIILGRRFELHDHYGFIHLSFADACDRVSHAGFSQNLACVSIFQATNTLVVSVSDFDVLVNGSGNSEECS